MKKKLSIPFRTLGMLTAMTMLAACDVPEYQREMKHTKLKYVLDIVRFSLTILCAMVGIFIVTIAWTSLIR